MVSRHKTPRRALPAQTPKHNLEIPSKQNLKNIPGRQRTSVRCGSTKANESRYLDSLTEFFRVIWEGGRGSGTPRGTVHHGEKGIGINMAGRHDVLQEPSTWLTPVAGKNILLLKIYIY